MLFKIEESKSYYIKDIKVEETKTYYVEAKSVDYASDKLSEALYGDMETVISTIEDDGEEHLND
jgi:hypothetical protein